jgi:hypothetical protein
MTDQSDDRSCYARLCSAGWDTVRFEPSMPTRRAGMHMLATYAIQGAVVGVHRTTSPCLFLLFDESTSHSWVVGGESAAHAGFTNFQPTNRLPHSIPRTTGEIIQSHYALFSLRESWFPPNHTRISPLLSRAPHPSASTQSGPTPRFTLSRERGSRKERRQERGAPAPKKCFMSGTRQNSPYSHVIVTFGLFSTRGDPRTVTPASLMGH